MLFCCCRRLWFQIVCSSVYENVGIRVSIKIFRGCPCLLLDLHAKLAPPLNIYQSQIPCENLLTHSVDILSHLIMFQSNYVYGVSSLLFMFHFV
jgi:hypothetical protein